MKVYLQNFKKERIEVECEPTDTTLQLKQKVEAQYHHSVASQNLVFKGKLLVDSAVIGDCGVIPDSTIIFFVKPTKQAAPAPSAPAPSAPATTTPQPAPKPAVESTPQPTGNTPSAATPSTPQNSVVNAAAVNELMQLGYDQERAQQALAAAKGDTRLALDYLMNGMPVSNAPTTSSAAGATQPSSSTPSSSTPLPSSTPSSSTPSSTSTSTHPLLDALRTHPQLNHIRQIVQANPSSLPSLVQTLSFTQPLLAQEIMQNPDVFAAVLAGLDGAGPIPEMFRHLSSSHPTTQRGGRGEGGESEEEESGEQEGEDMQAAEEAQLQAALRASQQAQSSSLSSQLTPDDEEKITQLISLTGAARNAAIEAYLVCGKNVEAAVNFLFDS